MPPPYSPANKRDLPLLIVRPMILTVPDSILKIRKAGVSAAPLRTMLSLAAPGPLIVRFLSTLRWPPVRTIEPVTVTLIVSLAAAAASVARSEPGPSSALVLTVRTAAPPGTDVNPSAAKHSAADTAVRRILLNRLI